ncbi:capsid cement protein [Methylomicrobium sp. Wu6]|uniref:capsid cement protein n=1 Tax=Methylomicrobium sp. Wu6 TaxID=3107928 RepID=UPI002DD61E69|nr:capsid cement protein [Methylomicrobium sp. Wu6]MEC4750044.1 hypothetical protein [Methylomicrobium sp. Wu6]
MRNEGLIKNFTAQGAISAYRIAKFGSADGTVVAAAAVSDLLLGVATRVPADASGDRVDIVLNGIAEVEYGGNVTRGAKLTADASGKAVAAAPAAGTNNQIIGIAMVSGVSGDIGSVLIIPSVLQG